MVHTLTRRIVVGLIGILIGWFGVWLLDSHWKSDAELQAESQRKSAEQVLCDGKVMNPGDFCMAFGKGAAERGGTYDEMKAKQVAAVQPDELRADDLIWRFVAAVPLLISAALLISVIVAFVVAARVPAGRRALAAAHGWTYERKHPTLAGEAGLFAPYLAGRNDASDVIAGEWKGFPFLIFSFRDTSSTEKAAFRVTLPIALPFMRVIDSSEHPFSSDTDPGVQAWLIAKLGIVPTKQTVTRMAFWAQDDRLVRVVSRQSRPSSIEAELDATVNLAERLVNAAMETVAEAEARDKSGGQNS
ncbi:hypothetical protein AB0C07_03350 [Actinoplanes missouriensis]|uniref:hypothetical protein n=1 Tax=Actinoplanes missouriensis TaxID=1866 RepID=UPI0033DF1033